MKRANTDNEHAHRKKNNNIVAFFFLRYDVRPTADQDRTPFFSLPTRDDDDNDQPSTVERGAWPGPKFSSSPSLPLSCLAQRGRTKGCPFSGSVALSQPVLIHLCPLLSYFYFGLTSKAYSMGKLFTFSAQTSTLTHTHTPPHLFFPFVVSPILFFLYLP